MPRSIPRLAPAAFLLILLSSTPAQGPDWSERQSIDGRAQFAMAYDQARERVVVFGGIRANYRWQDSGTWEWDGTTWRRRTTTTAPPAGESYGMAYDDRRRRIVLVGGGWPGSLQTWTFDGDDWRQIQTTGSPTYRANHQVVYDASRDRVVLFGGKDANAQQLVDTWELDGATWRLRPTTTTPPQSITSSMAYDEARQRTVLFQGQGGRWSSTWEWDGQVWTQRTSATQPGFLFLPTMAYDAARRRIVLFGKGNTWEWDGTSWTSTRTSRAPAAQVSPMVFDAARAEIVRFGGLADHGWPQPLDPAETWGYDGRNWRLRHTGDGYESSSRGAAYDTHRKVLVSLGGYYDGNSSLGQRGTHSGTREWNGVRWRQRTPATVPVARFHHAMAYDSMRRLTIAFGGIDTRGSGSKLLDETLAWDGSDWRVLRPTQNPPARLSHAMAFDEARGRVVLFGGMGSISVIADTWEWDGVRWDQLGNVGGPSPRSGHSMVYDPIGKRIVLHGGTESTTFNDTWTFDGRTWRMIANGGPPADEFHAMAYDPSRRAIVLHTNQELWQLTGNTWNRIATKRPLPRSQGGPMAWDTLRRALIVTGGGRTRFLGAVTPATVAKIGTGCGGSSGVPLLADAPAHLGDPDFRLALDRARDRAPTLFLLAAKSASFPIGGGCTAYVDTPVLPLATTSNALGHAELRLAIPLDAALRGLTIFVQAAVADPSGAGPGLTTSAGLQLTIGD